MVGSVGPLGDDVESGSGSDVGLRRAGNEDNFLEDERRALFAVADGMGGHVAGELASREAVRALDRTLSGGALAAEDRMRTLVEALLEAHEAVIEAGRGSAATEGMGTTAVVVHIDGQDGALACAHVGDSRAYVLHRGRPEGRLVRVTEDHARWFGGARRLTQAIGASPPLRPEAAEVHLGSGDRVLLCTDGLTDMLSDSEIAEVLGRDADAQQVCDELIDAARAQGGVDNTTCIVIDV